MLELRNVTKKFNLTGSIEDERIALDNVSLQIKPGEFVTIIGGNGSGKSTTLNIISGVLKPDKGSVTLNDQDITRMKEYRRAAYFGRVFQDPMVGTAGEMSVLENLEIAYQRGRKHSPFIWGFKKADKEYFIEELKRFDLGLENRLGQKVGVMSGGQRQALTLLMATIRNRPTLKMMRRDYILFSQKDRVKAATEFDNELNTCKIILKDKVDKIKESALPKKVIRQKVCSIKKEYDLKIIGLKKQYTSELANLKSSTQKSKNKKTKHVELKKMLKSNLFEVKNERKVRVDDVKCATKRKIIEAKFEFDQAMHAKFDLTKQILLLDEHTAALDPKTAKKVLELTDKIVRENQMTTLMITHNMKDALTYGDRLIMFHSGHIILDVSGEKKAKLKVDDLLKLFDEADEKLINE